SLFLYSGDLSFLPDEYNPLAQSGNDRLVVLETELQFEAILDKSTSVPVFLDLTYVRSSLLRKGIGNYRHQLKKDLSDIHSRLKPGTLLFGNMAHDQYVKEVLQRFSKEENVRVQEKGNFWFIRT
ncbi:MAG TPA: hypothetical protein VLF94_04115, partial [Chlamydiales bacterium]|nr:hypothetical protein [Chlamydiales bacterium]